MTRAVIGTALLAGLLVLTAVLTGFLLTQSTTAADRSDAEDLRQASSIAAVLPHVDRDTIARVVARMPAGAEGRLAVHLPGGPPIGVASAPDLSAVRDGTPRTISTASGDTLLYPAGQAVIEVRSRETGDWRAAAGQFVLLLVAGLGALCLALGLARVRARRVVTPLRALVRITGDLQPGEFRSPLPPRTAPELTQLSAALSHVAHRWAELLTDERKVMADLSHRLRTPLTALRLDADAVEVEPVGERIRRSVRALEREVDEVINGPGAAPVTGPCEVSVVVGERLEFWRTLAEAQSRECRVDLPGVTALVPLTERELHDVLDSLLVNVFQHTGPGTPFAASVFGHDGWVTLVVEDGGHGIGDPRAALRRGASSAGSTGLGLDIVRQCVETAGGTIHLERSALGGARVRLRLPEVGTSRCASEPLAWRLWNATRA